MNNELSTQPQFQRAPRLSEQVTDFLALEIKNGSLKPGEHLPSEAALAKQFGVSRTVIREAFARLKHDGLIDSKHGIGAIVAERSEQRSFRLDGMEHVNSKEIGHLFELRAILEGNAAALAAEHRSEEDLTRLDRCLKAMARAVNEGSDGTAPDTDFHQIVAEASSNPYLRDFMQFLNGKLRDQIKKARERSSRQPGLPMMVQQEHEAIFKAILKKEPDRARDAALVHIENTSKRLDLVISSALRRLTKA